MNNIIYDLKVRNDKRLIPEIALFVSNSAEKLGLSKRKSLFLCFTLETVLEFRTKEINQDNEEIDIQVIDTGRSFRFLVTDFGKPYILNKNQVAILNKKLVDKYYFEQLGRKGQKFAFSYNYDAIHTEIKTKEKEELLDENINCQRLSDNDEDILKAITCLYDSYGYEYYHQNLYSVESFKKYMQNGSYIPVIALNDHNQAMGYCALDENSWFIGVPELSNLVVEPSARGKGFATVIFEKTENIAKEMNYEGVHVSAVAYHPYTQKMCNKLGYTPSAIEYSINPKGTGGYDSERRLDCVIGVKIFNKTKKHDLYLASECNKLFNKIYSEENLNYQIINKSNPKASNENLISYFIDTDTSNCFFKIDSCSDNFESEIKEFLNSEEILNIDVITVNLNMNDESSIIGYKILKELGFICVGCIPASKNGDYMLLQKFKVEPVYEKIVVEDNYQELIQEIYALNNMGK